MVILPIPASCFVLDYYSKCYQVALASCHVFKYLFVYKQESILKIRINNYSKRIIRIRIIQKNIDYGRVIRGRN